MRHRKTGRKLGRSSSHRKALFSNMVTSLVKHGRIHTTEAKAKELRGIADRTINWAVSVHPILAKEPDAMSQQERAKVVHAKRMARRMVKDQEQLDRLFSDIAPQMTERQGGYTRVLKTRIRRGDAAPMAFIEIVGLEAS